MRKSVLDEKVVEMYDKRLMTLQMIGDVYGVTRQAVRKFLITHGVDTSKRLREVECKQCGKRVMRTRKRVRETKWPFCSCACYYEFIKNPDYQEHRQGQRNARLVIEQYLGVGVDFVSHHFDGDDDNNEVSNLWAFRTQADHMRYHRGGLSEAFIVSKGQWETVCKS
jgi:hypothetical protein